MILLQFKDNVQRILNYNDENFNEISKIYHIDLDKYENNYRIIYSCYASIY